MFTTLAAALILSCKPAYHPTMPPPPTTVACEGADQVRRNHDGLEIARVTNACTTVRCEGADSVRRTSEGAQVSRAVNACTISRCEGWDFVVRTRDGATLSRVSSAQRCMPYREPIVVRPPPPAPQSDVVRFGLSYR